MTDVTAPDAATENEIVLWLDAKRIAVAAVEAEREARAALTAKLFPTPKKGTQRFPLPRGYALKLVQSYKYDLCKTDADGVKLERDEINRRVDELIDALEMLGSEGASMAARLVKWSAELSGSEYEKLDIEFPTQAEIKRLIDEQLVISPASPQLEFEVPKAAKAA